MVKAFSDSILLICLHFLGFSFRICCFMDHLGLGKRPPFLPQQDNCLGVLRHSVFHCSNSLLYTLIMFVVPVRKYFVPFGYTSFPLEYSEIENGQ